MSDKQEGVVKEFCEEKRFGIIVSKGQEYFVHFSAIREKIQILSKGNAVLFKAGNGPKKFHAEGVELMAN